MPSNAHDEPVESRRSLILTFHGIGRPRRPLDPGEDLVWLTCDGFQRILDVVIDRADVEITFDDGNSSDLEDAIPALRERNLRATFFVLAGRIGESGALGATDLRDLVSHGMEIGSHGMDHTPWRRLDAQTVADEIVLAKAQLEAIVGKPVMKAACPFGAYDRRALAYAREAGFTTLFTSDGGIAGHGQWLRARNTVGAHDTPSTIAALLQSRSFGPDVWARQAKTLIKRLR